MSLLTGSAPLVLNETGAIHTEALRRALGSVHDPLAAADLIYLDNWEIASIPGVAAALRASQLRRANPELAAEIRAEVSARKTPPDRDA